MSDAPKSNLAAAAGAACSSVGLSGLAAAMGFCCYGPLAVTLVGVTGAAWFSRFEPYRPLVLIAAGALLVWAFWRVYRQPQRGVGIQLVLWLSLMLLLASLFLADLAPLFMRLGPPGG
ncbi:MAG: hypothetical protein ACT4OF_15240 [Caulobacteraceae bacterium]